MFFITTKQPIISDERKQQSAYCKICKLHDTDLKVGVICSLTNKAADFTNECPSIQIDYDLVDDYEVELHNKILAYIKRKYDLKLLIQENYIRPNHKINKHYHTKEKTHNVTFKKPFSLGGLATFSFFVIAVAFFSILSVDSMGVKVLLGLVCFVFFCLSIVGMVNDYYSPLKNALVVTKEAIIIDGKKVCWNDLVDYRIIKRGGEYKAYDLIIGTISEGVQRFDLLNLHIPTDRLIEILNLNKKQYFTRYDENLPAEFKLN